MSGKPVVIVAFEEFDNLGVRYLASMLSEGGYEPEVVDFRDGKEKILTLIKKLKPLVVGFSVIFQYHLYEFQELINFLRKADVKSHFSAGGQYASLRYRDLFDYLPTIDSIVRFEGEYTFLELVNHIYNGTDWRKIKGLAFREDGKIIANPLRQPEPDLDKFPFPMRPPLSGYAFGKKFATILAGRGCIHNCSFCNNTEYIKQSLFPFKRTRKPEKVVEEIDFLFREKDCSVFLFEDDDFPLNDRNEPGWINRFCKELEYKKLVGNIIWKINCRPDEVDYKSFRMMKEHGLYLVFLGIDDGTDDGLTTLNKNMTASQSLNGANILKKLDIGFDYGFMLFQPSSTFISVYKNLDFLKQLCADGRAPVKFLKLIPFFGTKVERNLATEGRLKGKPGFLNYDFLDNSLDRYYEVVYEYLMEWINHSEGMVNISEWARNYLSVFSHFYRMNPRVEAIANNVRKSVADSNLFLLDTMKNLAIIFESGKLDSTKHTDLDVYKENIKKNHDYYKNQIIKSIEELGHIAEAQSLKQLINL